MTPKEKAFELVDKYKIFTWDMEDDVEDHIRKPKECASVAVDEIIEFMEVDDFDSDTCYWANHSKMQYWVEVKQEIELLH